jgi:hypothetical protein
MSGLLAHNKICFKPLSIASVSPDTAASFNENAEPVNTDSSHRSYQRAIIEMTGLVLASLCRQADGEKTGQVKKGSATWMPKILKERA